MRLKLLPILVLFIPALLIAQDNHESKYDISISGFISSEIIYDTRQPVGAREGDVLLFTSPILNAINLSSLNNKLIEALKGSLIFHTFRIELTP
ncbi:MAG: hypothetical protein EA390_03490 [Balneolaceae bacterium]|nr:MAG: hypothetical protein EA390_03490 [Balneolaceae bacterium]